MSGLRLNEGVTGAPEGADGIAASIGGRVRSLFTSVIGSGTKAAAMVALLNAGCVEDQSPATTDQLEFNESGIYGPFSFVRPTVDGVDLIAAKEFPEDYAFVVELHDADGRLKANFPAMVQAGTRQVTVGFDGQARPGDRMILNLGNSETGEVVIPGKPVFREI